MSLGPKNSEITKDTREKKSNKFKIKLYMYVKGGEIDRVD